MTNLRVAAVLAVGLLGCKSGASPQAPSNTDDTPPVVATDFAGCDVRTLSILGEGGRAHVSVANLKVVCAAGVAELVDDDAEARYALTAAEWAAIWQPVPATWPACESGTGTFLWSIEVVDDAGKRGFQCEETDELPAAVRAVVDAATAVLAAKQPPQ